MVAAFDNDVICKGACYGLLAIFAESLNLAFGDIGVLGTARFVVRKKIQRTALERDQNAALDDLAALLTNCIFLDPTEGELLLAADFELAAQRQGLALDTGESQLCAMVVERPLHLLITGDKRAIEALEALLAFQPRLLDMCGRVRCLEQVVLAVVRVGGAAAVRVAVCREPDVDKALTNCFSCSFPELNLDDVVLGLESYINAIRAPQLLAS